MVNASILFAITVIVSAIYSFAIPINNFEVQIAERNLDNEVRAWTPIGSPGPGTEAMLKKRTLLLPETDLYARDLGIGEALQIVERNDQPTSASYAAREESVGVERRGIGDWFRNLGSKIKDGFSSAGNWLKDNWQQVAQVAGNVATKFI